MSELVEGLPDQNQERGPFRDRIQDDDVRNTLAAELAVRAFYHPINRGTSFNEALMSALYIAADNRNLIDEIATDPKFEFAGRTFPEVDWHKALDKVESDTPIGTRPGKIRSWLAKAALTEEVRIGKWQMALSHNAWKRFKKEDR